MSVLLDLALTEERAKICREATDASVDRDSLGSIARSVGISVGNCHANCYRDAVSQTYRQLE